MQTNQEIVEMADICAVCDKKIGMFSLDKIQGVVIHDTCREVFFKNPEKYGGKAIKRKEPEIAQESEPQSNKICPVCNEDLYGHVDHVWYPISDIKVHELCNNVFRQDPEHYGGVNADVSLDTHVSIKEQAKNEEKKAKAEKDHKEHQKKEPSDKDFVITLLICVFLGGLGVHRFFVDKMGTGVLMLVTLGGLGIWWIIDIILIVTGSFEDSEGRVIAYQAAGAVNREPTKDIPAEIRKFAELKKDGLISEEEFDKKKKELLK